MEVESMFYRLLLVTGVMFGSLLLSGCVSLF